MSFKVKDAIEFGGGVAISRNTRTQPKGLYIAGGPVFSSGGANGGATVEGFRITSDQASPADFDLVQLNFHMNDDAGNSQLYSRIAAYAQDVSAGGVDGALIFSGVANDTTFEWLRAGGNGGQQLVTINENAASLDFRIEGAVNQFMVMMDGSGNNLSFGANTTAGAFLSLTAGAQSRAQATAVGYALDIKADTYVDSGATDPIAISTAVFLGIPTVSDATKVYTRGTNLYIQGAAAVTGGASMTAAHALWVDAGSSRFEGAIDVVAAELTVQNATAATATAVLTNRVAANAWLGLTLVGDNIADGSDNDTLTLRFQMMDDGTPVLDTYAEIVATAIDVSTAGDLDGQIALRAAAAGTTTDVLRCGFSTAAAESYGFFGSYAAFTAFATNEAGLDYTLDDAETTQNTHEVLSALITELLAHGVISG
jgi:hypothetical protein